LETLLSPELLAPTPHDGSAEQAAIDDKADVAAHATSRPDDIYSVEAAASFAPDLAGAVVEKFSALDDDEVATAPPTKSETSRREPTIGARDLRQLSGDVANDPLLDTRLESPLEFSAGSVSGLPLMATDPPEEVETYTDLNTDLNTDLDRRDEKPKNSRRWAVLCGAMVIILASQFVFYFRHSLAETYPQLRPSLASACASLGCRLSWARDAAAIDVKASELVELPSKPGRMLANAVLVNRGKVTQEYPAIELRLTNNTNQIVMSRILQPSDYVARPTTVAGSPEPGGVDKTIVEKTLVEKGFAPNAEVALSLTIEVPPKTAASGYEFLPFYP